MKIAIPVQEKSMETNVSESFGRSTYFLIYDVDSKESKFIDNQAINSQGGAGIKAAQTIVDSNVNTLIVPQCGENAAEVLNAANVKLYKTINNSIEENINAFKNNELSVLEEIHKGHHGGGGK